MGRVIIHFCEQCGTEDDSADIDDVPYGWIEDIEISDTYYEHLCEDCYYDTSACESCGTLVWSDNSYWCETMEDLHACSDQCIADLHEKYANPYEIEFDEEGCCESCGIFVDSAPSDKTGEWTTLIP